jgi:DNA-binding response OmpR family regulator
MNNKKTKILIIEDEEILVEVLKKKLETEGHEVVAAPDGVVGLELVEREAPDLILLDIVMPRLNGYEVLSALQKKYGTHAMPPVIIISNSGQPVEIDRAIGLGARDYIIKAQFTPEEVIGKVNKVLGLIGQAPQTDQQPGGPAKRPPSPSKKPEARVLVIEDDQFLRDLLTTKLEKENFQVTTAIDGPLGLEKIKDEMPDVILLDIILPGIDGFEVLKRVRTNVNMQLASLPIILLSNLGQEADIEKGRALGANDYLIKSNFTIDEIIEKLRKILGTHP